MSVSTESRIAGVKASFNFSIDKFPLSGPDGMSTDWYGLFRSDTSKTVGNGSVTKRYVPHQTEDVLALVESAVQGFDAYDANVQCSFRDGHYVVIEPSKADRRKLIGATDSIWPRIFIRAAYDGRSFMASMGFYRDACANLAMLRTISQTHVTIRHTSSLPEKMDELIAQFSVLRESWGTLQSVVEQMSQADIVLSEYLDSVYGAPPQEAGRGLTVHRNRTEQIVRRVMRERHALNQPNFGGTVSAWEAFNAVQGFVQHNATRKGNATPFQRALMAAEDATVLKAEKQALMAV